MKILLLLLFYSISSYSQIQYEGWHKITSSDKHVGYFVQRYEYNPTKNEFISTYFLNTTQDGNNITESLKAICTKGLVPLSYQYTTKLGNTVKIVDAKFKKTSKGLTVNGEIKEGEKTEKINTLFDKDAILSTFLYHALMTPVKNKAKNEMVGGLKVGNKFNYKAIAEEDLKMYTGTAYVSELSQIKGFSAFKLLNVFKEYQFISYISPEGKILRGDTPLLNITTEHVTDINEATKGQNLPLKTLRTLFGNVPEGGTIQKTGETKNIEIKTDKKDLNIKPVPEE